MLGVRDQRMSDVNLPRHADFFYPNLNFGVLKHGYTAIVNLQNYYNDMLFGPEGASDAVAEVRAFDEDGVERFASRALLAPNGNLHVDLGAELKAGGGQGTVAAVYARLVPLRVPERLAGKRVSTEYVVELVGAGGSRDLLHNIGGPTMMPSLGRRQSDMIFGDRFARPAHLVLANTYWGPRIPFVSDGVAWVCVVNADGMRYSATTKAIPARGISLVSLHQLLPNIDSFLGGKAGIINIHSVNLARKPWVWYGRDDLAGPVALEHA